ncbi:MAG: hypothetical protein J07HX64_01471 [halophilic archaeon J07HX64]|nr:MAG: hypothetical protein J07HX64_01471 [halophilic archaeon J07HX64]
MSVMTGSNGESPSSRPGVVRRLVSGCNQQFYTLFVSTVTDTVLPCRLSETGLCPELNSLRGTTGEITTDSQNRVTGTDTV